MKTETLIFVGGAVGLVAVAVWKYFTRDPRPIDPATGGVELAPGEVYGPPASLATTPIATGGLT